MYIYIHILFSKVLYFCQFEEHAFDQAVQVGEAELGERAAAIAVGFQELASNLIAIGSRFDGRLKTSVEDVLWTSMSTSTDTSTLALSVVTEGGGLPKFSLVAVSTDNLGDCRACLISRVE